MFACSVSAMLDGTIFSAEQLNVIERHLQEAMSHSADVSTPVTYLSFSVAYMGIQQAYAPTFLCSSYGKGRTPLPTAPLFLSSPLPLSFVYK